MHQRKASLEKIIFKISLSLLLLVFLSLPFSAFAQQQPQEEKPSPRGAFLRSLVVPGWGHYYAEKNNWNRGKYHLAAEAVLLLTYAGLNIHSETLQNDYFTLAQSKAGTSLDGKSRQYRIAVGNYDNLRDYNDAQLQTRNWTQVYPETAEFNWNWENREFRNQYQNTRERVDRYKSQLPSLVALMVVNRLVSGVSAFIHARNRTENLPQANFSYINEFGEPGFTARVVFEF